MGGEFERNVRGAPNPQDTVYEYTLCRQPSDRQTASKRGNTRVILLLRVTSQAVSAFPLELVLRLFDGSLAVFRHASSEPR